MPLSSLLRGARRLAFPAVLMTLAAALPARADVVTDWNQIAIKTALDNPPPALYVVRNLAIVHLAIHDAVNAARPRYRPYLYDVRAAAGASPEAAALGAAHAALLALYPTQKAILDAAFNRDLARWPDDASRAAGLAAGRAAAERILAARRDDGADATATYTPNAADPQGYKPTFPAFLPALQPQFARLKPFFVRDLFQFDPGPPLTIDNPRFVEEFEEVRRLGAKNSAERTVDQTAVAIFWTAPSFTIFSPIARQLSESRKFDLHDNARLFALLNGATIDAYASGWAVKYKYPTARPITLIREADRLGNPALKADPAWEPLLITPNHPNYISGHSIYAGAAEQVLQGVFGTDDIPVVAATYPVNGVTRRYTKISQIAEENDNGRVWGGIHTRQTVGRGGADQGRKIGQFAVQNFLRPLN